MERLYVFLALFGFRLVNSIALQTFYVPDEYWQSLEVAHRAVFGYGELTWEWEKRIRGFFHPLIFALAFSFLRHFDLDSRTAVILTPKIIQATLSAVGDFYFYRFAKRVVGVRAAKWATFSYLTNHFALFSLTRTLSNSLETILSVVALSFFPFPHENDDEEDSDDDEKPLKVRGRREMMAHLSLAALTVVVRPTAVITWIPLWLPKLFSKKIEKEEKTLFAFELMVVAIVAILASTSLDSLYYGQMTFVPWEFLRWNVFRGVASFYGSHPFHWYITQGFPAILGPHLFPFLASLHLLWKERFSARVDNALLQYREKQKQKERKQKTKSSKPSRAEKKSHEAALNKPTNDLLLVKLIFWIVCIYSLLAHKEFRFIFTTLPIAMCLVGKYYDSMSQRTHRALLVGVVTLVNLLSFFYLALYHQRGNLDVMNYLGDRFDRMNQTQRDETFVLFLLPCHQHPYFSHLHHDVRMRFLHCEPHFAGADSVNYDPEDFDYAEEADRFFAVPPMALHSLLDGQTPSHVILSRKTKAPLSAPLKRMGLTRVKTFFHSHIEMDGRMGTELFLYERETIDTPIVSMDLDADSGTEKRVVL